MNTRFAPSPTGFFHIGSLRTAYFNYLAAKATGGKFILRIDDTDTERNKPEYEDLIYRTLEHYGLHWDEKIKQSERFQPYRNYANELIKQDFAHEKDGCIKLDWTWHYFENYAKSVSFIDGCIGRICITEQDKEGFKDLVLIKSDGIATYNFATVIDDYEYIDDLCVIRGVDHISNTPKQLFLCQILDLQQKPEYNHIGLLTDNYNKKISKRDSNADVRYYSKFEPQAVLNWILRLGWSPTKDDKSNQFIDTEQAISMFMTQGKMSASNAKLNEQKLDFYHNHYKTKTC